MDNQLNGKAIRVRIAPSPTGNLHVGTARSAIFNELFARSQGGVFMVRVEDTDKARSKPEFEKNILAGLQWLGLTWQEGPDVGGPYAPYRQSERGETYTSALQKLLDEGKAYRDGEAIKLKVEPQEISFDDLVRGSVTVHTDTFGGDFVIARSLHDPLFHLAVVVDDALMDISHVIRGEDHISNTPKHILIQRALGYATPIYAHIPLLLDEKRAKLSKRKSETSLLAFRDMGYLPEAMLNYLALLGWNPGDDKELFTHDELAAAFSLQRVQKGGAIFSLVKLQAVNRHYIRKLSPAELLGRWREYLQLTNNSAYDVSDEPYWAAAVATEQERVATLGDLVVSLAFYQKDWSPSYETETLVWKKSDRQKTISLMEILREKVSGLQENDFAAKKLESIFIEWIDAQQLGRGDTLWPMRVALTGREHSPGPFEVASVLGKSETLRRIDLALKKLI